MCLYSEDYTINHNENKDENEKCACRYDINRPRPRNGHKYSKHKKCPSTIMLICIKQHPSNIWSSIYEKVKKHWGWVEKKALVIKKACRYTCPNLMVNYFHLFWISEFASFASTFCFEGAALI